MLKLVYCITRRADLTPQAFNEYWRDIHGPLGAQIPGLRRLVQSPMVRDPRDAHPPAFDGLAELWFDDWASLLAARQSPEWQRSSADEPNFIDHKKVFVCEEREIAIPQPLKSSRWQERPE
jgi:uncharacterized protein (TIGR02118 family)